MQNKTKLAFNIIRDKRDSLESELIEALKCDKNPEEIRSLSNIIHGLDLSLGYMKSAELEEMQALSSLLANYGDDLACEALVTKDPQGRYQIVSVSDKDVSQQLLENPLYEIHHFYRDRLTNLIMVRRTKLDCSLLKTYDVVFLKYHKGDYILKKNLADKLPSRFLILWNITGE